MSLRAKRNLSPEEWDEKIKNFKPYIPKPGLREYWILNSSMNEKREIKIDVLIRDDDDYPYMYYPEFDLKSKTMYCNGLAFELCENIICFDFLMIYGRPLRFVT